MTKKNKLIIIVISLISVIILGIMGAGFYMIWNKVSSFAPQKEEAPEKVVEEKTDEETIGPIFPLDTFIVNLADKGGKRFLRITMDLELSGNDLANELTKRKSQIADGILMILPTKRFEDIRSVEGKIALRDELISKTNSFLKTGKITNIYFKEFVIQ